jgi:tRNA threonylcarbamoyladenosine modification (KEOPS) complex  Pcc1 subunit
MKEINSTDYYVVTAVANNSVTLNDVNSLAYTAYTSGGVLEYNQPVDLNGYTARMQIREKVTSTTVIKELTTNNGGILIDNATKTITINISATDTAALNFKSAVYSLELITGSTVIPFVYGSVSLESEITR